MHRIRFLPHIADVRVRLEADSQEELFRAALTALNRLLKKNACRKNGGRGPHGEIAIEAKDATALLVDFLSEALSAAYTEKAVYCRVYFEELTATRLRAALSGRPVRAFDEDVKAVTYHEAEVVRDEKTGLWSTFIIFDI